MVRGLNQNGEIEEIAVEVDPAKATAAQVRKQARAAKNAAERELRELKNEAINYFIRGEAYPAELKTHLDAVQAIAELDPATVTDVQEIPAMPARPVIDLEIVEPVL